MVTAKDLGASGTAALGVEPRVVSSPHGGSQNFGHVVAEGQNLDVTFSDGTFSEKSKTFFKAPNRGAALERVDSGAPRPGSNDDSLPKRA